MMRGFLSQPPVLFLLAFLLLAVGWWAGQTGQAHRHYLAATPKLSGGVFKDSVIAILYHTRSGAKGLVVNRDGFGGPVAADEFYVIFSNDVAVAGAAPAAAGLAYLSGEVAAARFEKLERKPRWWRVVKGYSGWGPGQLDAEIADGRWRVSDDWRVE